MLSGARLCSSTMRVYGEAEGRLIHGFTYDTAQQRFAQSGITAISLFSYHKTSTQTVSILAIVTSGIMCLQNKLSWNALFQDYIPYVTQFQILQTSGKHNIVKLPHFQIASFDLAGNAKFHDIIPR